MLTSRPPFLAETQEEADAWLLQQGELDEEAVMQDGLLKPGPSLDTL